MLERMEKKIASAYCNDVLGTLDGVELAELIAVGEIKAVEVVEAAITRAQKVNPSLNAIATETYEQALIQAGQSKNAFCHQTVTQIHPAV